MHKQGLPPRVAQDNRVLILGSLPGDASLQAGEYYAHPRNAFWPVLSALLRQPLTTLPWPQRYATLASAGIGLWDVIDRAIRPGSLDQRLSAINTNTLAMLIGQLPQLRAVAFNGQTAARLGRPLIGDLPCLVLPSTSPAHTLPLADKIAAWSALSGYLDPA
ncbi:DNA-deoxyinosine glycosylase [Chitiniphilus purpureus]|uniref:DNA-deoxyinosine glycosylase n=1 Tax=Chitiniphilus purpureus TaxID=2981137 RepID=A0ABY6DKN5_9NEIS|nr:DNA-deoxyinosine glycosylase [Chitiniphilus sp. CD1]UXY14021.1 DNA-deoxyinosine glycosylase [Chitiniphilus sp. CD1]